MLRSLLTLVRIRRHLKRRLNALSLNTIPLIIKIKLKPREELVKYIKDFRNDTWQLIRFQTAY